MSIDIVESLRSKTVREMEKRSWSKAELARRAGVEGSRVKDVLSGKSLHPRIDTVAAIASAFDRTVSEMIGEIGRESRAVIDSTLQDRLQEIVSTAAEDVLIYAREEKASDDSGGLAEQISEVFRQRLEVELIKMRPITVHLGGNVVEIHTRKRPA